MRFFIFYLTFFLSLIVSSSSVTMAEGSLSTETGVGGQPGRFRLSRLSQTAQNACSAVLGFLRDRPQENDILVPGGAFFYENWLRVFPEYDQRQGKNDSYYQLYGVFKNLLSFSVLGQTWIKQEVWGTVDEVTQRQIAAVLYLIEHHLVYIQGSYLLTDLSRAESDRIGAYDQSQVRTFQNVIYSEQDGILPFVMRAGGFREYPQQDIALLLPGVMRTFENLGIFFNGQEWQGDLPFLPTARPD